MVRSLVIAPAQMHPRLLRRNRGQCMVQRRDMEPCPLAEFLDRQVGILDVPSHRQVRAIDLHDDAGGCDRLVLGAHRLCDGEQVGLLVRIVVVAEEQRNDPRRGGAEKRAGGVHPGKRPFQVVDVGERRGRIANRDRAGTGRCSPARPAGITEHPLRQVRELSQVLIHKGIAASGKPGQPVLDVGGVARLGHLAVVDEIDARLDLFLNHRGDGLADLRRQGGALDRNAFLLGEHRPDQIIGTRQAAGVGGQKAVEPIRHHDLRQTRIAAVRGHELSAPTAFLPSIHSQGDLPMPAIGPAYTKVTLR